MRTAMNDICLVLAMLAFGIGLIHLLLFFGNLIEPPEPKDKE
jgi:hypothetical protein